MSHRIASVSAIAGAVVLLAMPAAASAVTGSVAKPCYTHIPTKGSEPIVVSLAGGTPGADFVLAATVPNHGTGSAGSATGTFDAAGNATSAITDVAPPSGTIDPSRGQTIQLSVEDFGAAAGPVDTPIGQTLVTNLALSVASKPTSPRAHRAVAVSGTPFAGEHMYGFIVHGTSRHVLRRVSLGTANACGYVRHKAIVAPRSFKRGSYRLYVNGGRSLHKNLALGLSFRIRHIL